MFALTVVGGCDPAEHEALLAAEVAQDDEPEDLDAEEPVFADAIDEDDASPPAEPDLDRSADPLDPEATYVGWTPWTSEEYAPVACDPGSLVSQFGCSGAYCDNVRLHCAPQSLGAGGTEWTSYFSEENAGSRICSSRYWLSSVACNGKYCDNIALQCTYYGATSPKNCYWTGWLSEEAGGTLSFGAGYFARGVQCSGPYCDNKRFYVCQR